MVNISIQSSSVSLKASNVMQVLSIMLLKLWNSERFSDYIFITNHTFRVRKSCRKSFAIWGGGGRLHITPFSPPKCASDEDYNQIQTYRGDDTSLGFVKGTLQLVGDPAVGPAGLQVTLDWPPIPVPKSCISSCIYIFIYICQHFIVPDGLWVGWVWIRIHI